MASRDFGELVKVATERKGRYWRMRSDEPSAQDERGRSSVLLTIPTANVWHMTHAMLTSLANTYDDFDLLFTDDLSIDHTVTGLAQRQVFFLQPASPDMGLTYLWNMAYRYWRDNGYKYLFISNNDVLVPNGVIDKLVKAMGTERHANCTVVTPSSTVKGKGHVGHREGLEVLYKLEGRAVKFVNNPMNYASVQRMLDEAAHQREVHTTKWEFNGFFFGLSQRITRFELPSGNLFSPENHVVRQERDLYKRIRAAGMKVCLHTGTFVFHHKNATVPDGKLDEREKFRHPSLNHSIIVPDYLIHDKGSSSHLVAKTGQVPQPINGTAMLYSARHGTHTALSGAPVPGSGS